MASKHVTGAPAPFDVLTRTQLEVAKQLALGENRREIAAALGVSVKTVDSHRLAVLQRLNLKNEVLLARAAIAAGVVCSPLEAPVLRADRPAGFDAWGHE